MKQRVGKPCGTATSKVITRSGLRSSWRGKLRRSPSPAFATGVEGPDELDRSRPELEKQSKRVRDWLHEGGGFAIAAAAAESESTETASPVTGEGTPQSSSTPPPTFFGLLKQVSDATD